MDTKDIKNFELEVKKIIAERMGLNMDQIKSESHFLNDLGMDSLDAVELIMSLEEKLGVSIPDEMMDKLQTVGDVVNYIKEEIHKGKK